jgi:hypothetical protein
VSKALVASYVSCETTPTVLASEAIVALRMSIPSIVTLP